ncbi:chloromuconate cycloisomerase [Haloarcula hispanica N601]|uniref:Chloromuconate cycloisomerase n=2 Tax=Haloarcula hispanica TaxID=51589 RepID=V5TL36_HALHI|nr:dipeptide epimerase [Haloarcula hispanica]AEM56598.1 chloromuconate cycloisomerase [Haloarcula hispanica ATCC 33960]AHB65400.1 chloromuconate cycloisomerase [Haloarcula hispanica N601]
MTRIDRISVEPLDHELREPFEISLGTREKARNLVVTVETDSGVVGHGEGSPLPPVTGETQAAAVATARSGTSLLEGASLADYRELVSDLRAAVPGGVSALFAVETALLDAYCRDRAIPLSELFGGAPTTVTTDITVPIVTPDAAAERATRAATAGFDHIKVKAGGEVGADVARTVAVADAAPDATITVDANQGWTPKAAATFVDEVTAAGVDLALVEQPTPKDDICGLARARDRLPVPVAADETVFTPADATAVVREGAADVINVKLGKSGLLGAAAIVNIAEAASLDCMLGCMLEGATGIATSAHLAAGLGAFDYVDLDGHLLFDECPPSMSFGPRIDIDGPGHGVSPPAAVCDATER